MFTESILGTGDKDISATMENLTNRDCGPERIRVSSGPLLESQVNALHLPKLLLLHSLGGGRFMFFFNNLLTVSRAIKGQQFVLGQRKTRFNLVLCLLVLIKIKAKGC